MPPRGPAKALGWWETHGVGAKRTGRVTYLPWSGKAPGFPQTENIARRRDVWTAHWLDFLPPSFSATFQNDLAIFAVVCKFLVLIFLLQNFTPSS